MKLEPEDDDYLVYLDSLGLEELYSLDDDNVDVIVAIGKKLTGDRQFSAAEEYYQRAIEISPWDCWPLLYLGNLYYGWGKHSRALAEFKAAIELEPNLACPYWCAADAYAATNQVELATTMYRKAVEVDPDDNEAKRRLTEWNSRPRL